MEEFNQQLSDLYEACSDRFYAAAYAILQNREDAEDAIIETFLRIIGNREKFMSIPPDKQPAYAKTILKNVALDMIRKRRDHANDELSDDIPDDAFSPERGADASSMYSRLVERIRSMSDSLKQALYLRVNYGFTSKQIAAALGISDDAARKRVSDAQKQIREFLKEEEL